MPFLLLALVAFAIAGLLSLGGYQTETQRARAQAAAEFVKANPQHKDLVLLWEAGRGWPERDRPPLTEADKKAIQALMVLQAQRVQEAKLRAEQAGKEISAK